MNIVNKQSLMAFFTTASVKENVGMNALVNLPLLMFALLVVLSPVQAQAVEQGLAGKTILAKGKVVAVNQQSDETRKLRRRSKIFNVDKVTTGDKAKAQFSMADGGLLTLKENTQILINNYQYDQATGEGSATLEVVNGGLRSISGLIKKSGGDYQVKTPVGSIGIRGTHFAVDVQNDEVFFAVYSGNIDVKLINQETLSLGVNEDFAFAAVNTKGKVRTFTQVPAGAFDGFAETSSKSKSSNNRKNKNQDKSEETNPNKQASVATGEGGANTAEIIPESLEKSLEISPFENQFSDQEALTSYNSLYNESQWLGINSEQLNDLISERTGTLAYSAIDSAIDASLGGAGNFEMTMAIDFDNAVVPGGTLNFTDNAGEWFASYSGVINVDKLDVGVSFAAHDNNRADGEIKAQFGNDLEEVFGSFNLHEVDDSTVNAQGSFTLKSGQ